MIPFESPAIVGSSPCSDSVGSAGDFSGTRRKRHGCRPNRTPAAGRRDRRQPIGPPQPFPSPRRARQAQPGASPVCGLPLVQPPRRFRCAHGTVGCRTPRGRTPLRLAFRVGAAEAGGVARRVFRARRGRRRAGSPRGADAEAKASGSIHLAEVLSGGARKSSERAAPRAAASDNGSVCHCPVRKSGIRVASASRLLRTPLRIHENIDILRIARRKGFRCASVLKPKEGTN